MSTPSPMDFSGIKTYSVKDRPSKVNLGQLAQATAPTCSFAEFMDSLPRILKAGDLRNVAEAIVSAHARGRPFIIALGAHVIKCGLGPLIIDLIQRGVVTGLAMNGATAVHDFELAYQGATSEDVAAALTDGSFGMAEETAEAYRAAAEDGAKGCGFGRAIGRLILDRKLPNAQLSILATAAEHEIPATVHIAIGTDIVHPHPGVSGANLGEASYLDFRIICQAVTDLDGGVWLNLGSAVLLPEVFLKAISAARNLTGKPHDFTTVNMDMIQHYRPMTNVVTRPTAKGFHLTGHHEIMFPLLRMAVLNKITQSNTE